MGESLLGSLSRIMDLLHELPHKRTVVPGAGVDHLVDRGPADREPSDRQLDGRQAGGKFPEATLERIAPGCVENEDLDRRSRLIASSWCCSRRGACA